MPTKSLYCKPLTEQHIAERQSQHLDALLAQSTHLTRGEKYTTLEWAYLVETHNRSEMQNLLADIDASEFYQLLDQNFQVFLSLIQDFPDLVKQKLLEDLKSTSAQSDTRSSGLVDGISPALFVQRVMRPGSYFTCFLKRDQAEDLFCRGSHVVDWSSFAGQYDRLSSVFTACQHADNGSSGRSTSNFIKGLSGEALFCLASARYDKSRHKDPSSRAFYQCVVLRALCKEACVDRNASGDAVLSNKIKLYTKAIDGMCRNKDLRRQMGYRNLSQLLQSSFDALSHTDNHLAFIKQLDHHMLVFLQGHVDIRPLIKPLHESVEAVCAQNAGNKDDAGSLKGQAFLALKQALDHIDHKDLKRKKTGASLQKLFACYDLYKQLQDPPSSNRTDDDLKNQLTTFTKQYASLGNQRRQRGFGFFLKTLDKLSKGTAAVTRVQGKQVESMPFGSGSEQHAAGSHQQPKRNDSSTTNTHT